METNSDFYYMEIVKEINCVYLCGILHICQSNYESNQHEIAPS